MNYSDNTYMLPDGELIRKMGLRLKASRLKQNITQENLSQLSEVPLSTLKRLENGGGGSLDTYLRLVRTLGLLDQLLPLIEEETLSPQAYFEMTRRLGGQTRQRAVEKKEAPKEENRTW